MIVIKTMFTAVAFIFVACGSTDKAASDANAGDSNDTTTLEAPNLEAKKMERTKMLEDGYMEGTIVISDVAGDCPVTIKVVNKTDTLMFDPINIDETYGSFRQNEMKVWFKYSPLRMMNRCDKANPVNLIDMQARM